MRKIKNIIWNVLNALGIGGILQLFFFSTLKDDGWFRSFRTKEAVDGNGNPVPWLTYSFIKFIKPRLRKEMEILEFGSGNSTLWFAARVKSITAVEHNFNWFIKMEKNIPENASVIFKSADNIEEYLNFLKNSTLKYDIIIIDAVHRNIVAKFCELSLKNDGIIIFDNTQVEDYSEGISYLIEKGFKRLDFVGMLPIISYDNTTTIFYKANNCIGI